MTSEFSQHISPPAEQQYRYLSSSDTDLEKDVMEDTPQQMALSGSVDAYEEWSPSRRQPFPIQFDIRAAYKRWLPSRRRIHKVSRPLRMQEQHNQSVYEPIMVSLGPYHYGKKEFREVDEFKHLCIHWCVDGNDEIKDHLFKKILDIIDQVRSCYAEVSIVNQFDDDNLALMMLLDACFIINFMMIRVSDVVAKNSYNCLGVAAALPFAARDIMLVENQIPFDVLKILLSEIYGKEEAKIAIEGFLSGLMSMQSERAVIPREAEDPPVHILEACRRVLVERDIPLGFNNLLGPTNPIVQENKPVLTGHWISSALPMRSQVQQMCNYASNGENTRYASKENTSYRISCPSVTFLKSKGIRVRPSSSLSLKDIKFESHALYGELQLPVCYVSNLTLVFLSNMIAYEVAPDNTIVSPDLTVLSYTNFMKALIQTPADVIELQQKGILRINRFANQDQVVELFKSIDTINLRDTSLYQDVMVSVGEHCNNKAKTWMADLIHGKLKSPWTIIALLSAIILLCLTFLQAFFTIHPVG